jgi:hypothetical protein
LTGKRQKHWERITLLWMWFLNVGDNVPMDLKPSLRNNGIVFEDSDVNWELDGVKFNITGDTEL